MTMNLDRFAALVDAYGSSPARWPEAERAAAQALLATSAEARRLAQEADALDRLLDQTETAPATLALQDRILASLGARAVAPRKLTRSFTLARWLPAGAIVCSLALGVLAGIEAPVLAGLDDEALAQAVASRAMTSGDSDAWLGGVE
jgi:hypothetical protein